MIWLQGQQTGRFAEVRRSLRGLLLIVAIALFIFLIEETMHWIGFFNEGQAVWWPTNGFALALMLRVDRRRWAGVLVGVLLGSLIGEFVYHYPMPTNLVNMAANAFGPLLAAFMLPRFRLLDDWMQQPRLVFRFVTFPLLLAPAGSALIAASGFYLLVPHLHFWLFLQRRGVADMLGFALFTPLTLIFSSRASFRLPTKRTMVLNALLVLLVVGATSLVFSQSTYPLIFVLTAVTLLVAMQVSFGVSTVAVNLLAAIATTATMHGVGPMVLGGGNVLSHRIFLLQAFLTLTMVMVLSISVVQIDRAQSQTKLRQAYEQMEKLATIDSLTGIGNRRLFEDTLEAEWNRALRSSDPLAVLMIDADNFKSYNDRYGHLAGDDCLREIARAILSLDRRSTDLLSRFGGEEFVFLLPGTTLEGARLIAETIRSRVETLDAQQGRGTLQRKVTVSIGCAAIVPGPEVSPTRLLAAADEELYNAKQKGKNRVEAAGLRGWQRGPEANAGQEGVLIEVEESVRRRS